MSIRVFFKRVFYQCQCHAAACMLTRAIYLVLFTSLEYDVIRSNRRKYLK